MLPLKLHVNFKCKMFFNNSIPLSMDVTFDFEISPPLSFGSNKGKVYNVADVSVIAAIVEVFTLSYHRTS